MERVGILVIMKPMLFGLIVGFVIALLSAPVIFAIALVLYRHRKRKEREMTQPTNESDEMCAQWLQNLHMGLEASIRRVLNRSPCPLDEREQRKVPEIEGAGRHKGLSTVVEANESTVTVVKVSRRGSA